jgi:hypothetical protein
MWSMLHLDKSPSLVACKMQTHGAYIASFSLKAFCRFLCWYPVEDSAIVLRGGTFTGTRYCMCRVIAVRCYCRHWVCAKEIITSLRAVFDKPRGRLCKLSINTDASVSKRNRLTATFGRWRECSYHFTARKCRPHSRCQYFLNSI